MLAELDQIIAQYETQLNPELLALAQWLTDTIRETYPEIDSVEDIDEFFLLRDESFSSIKTNFESKLKTVSIKRKKQILQQCFSTDVLVKNFCLALKKELNIDKLVDFGQAHDTMTATNGSSSPEASEEASSEPSAKADDDDLDGFPALVVVGSEGDDAEYVNALPQQQQEWLALCAKQDEIEAKYPQLDGVSTQASYGKTLKQVKRLRDTVSQKQITYDRQHGNAKRSILQSFIHKISKTITAKDLSTFYADSIVSLNEHQKTLLGLQRREKMDVDYYIKQLPKLQCEWDGLCGSVDETLASYPQALADTPLSNYRRVVHDINQTRFVIKKLRTDYEASLESEPQSPNARLLKSLSDAYQDAIPQLTTQHHELRRYLTSYLQKRISDLAKKWDELDQRFQSVVAKVLGEIVTACEDNPDLYVDEHLQLQDVALLCDRFSRLEVDLNNGLPQDLQQCQKDNYTVINLNAIKSQLLDACAQAGTCEELATELRLFHPDNLQFDVETLRPLIPAEEPGYGVNSPASFLHQQLTQLLTYREALLPFVLKTLEALCAQFEQACVDHDKLYVDLLSKLMACKKTIEQQICDHHAYVDTQEREHLAKLAEGLQDLDSIEAQALRKQAEGCSRKPRLTLKPIEQQRREAEEQRKALEEQARQERQRVATEKLQQDIAGELEWLKGFAATELAQCQQYLAANQGAELLSVPITTMQHTVDQYNQEREAIVVALMKLPQHQHDAEVQGQFDALKRNKEALKANLQRFVKEQLVSIPLAQCGTIEKQLMKLLDNFKRIEDESLEKRASTQINRRITAIKNALFWEQTEGRFKYKKEQDGREEILEAGTAVTEMQALLREYQRRIDNLDKQISDEKESIRKLLANLPKADERKLPEGAPKLQRTVQDTGVYERTFFEHEHNIVTARAINLRYDNIIDSFNAKLREIETRLAHIDKNKGLVFQLRQVQQQHRELMQPDSERETARNDYRTDVDQHDERKRRYENLVALKTRTAVARIDQEITRLLGKQFGSLREALTSYLEWRQARQSGVNEASKFNDQRITFLFDVRQDLVGYHNEYVHFPELVRSEHLRHGSELELKDTVAQRLEQALHPRALEELANPPHRNFIVKLIRRIIAHFRHKKYEQNDAAKVNEYKSGCLTARSARNIQATLLPIYSFMSTQQPLPQRRGQVTMQEATTAPKFQ